ncbi:phage scaffolding protein [Cohnella thailandensis]|uniref:Phage scaffolding protein n=1 Tax=Cohnella thailandensis TaxID=557557 RepID=A0A841SSJ1_9BACL|nr:phage scaffolding protein [Cohnella thailandensis]MBB6633556.1 phage scaffolding protein [Cohnella thailandensis]MBP1974573.1 hypothetical protein [Cohnella thailandensis]
MDLLELLGERLHAQVLAKSGEKHKIAIVSDGTWIPKGKFNEANKARRVAEETLKERDKQIEELRRALADVDSLKARMTRLLAGIESVAENYEAELIDLKLNAALKQALIGKVHDPNIVIGLIDKTKIEWDESGNVRSGLDDQIEALCSSKAFLFISESLR